MQWQWARARPKAPTKKYSKIIDWNEQRINVISRVVQRYKCVSSRIGLLCTLTHTLTHHTKYGTEIETCTNTHAIKCCTSLNYSYAIKMEMALLFMNALAYNIPSVGDLFWLCALCTQHSTLTLIGLLARQCAWLLPKVCAVLWWKYEGTQWNEWSVSNHSNGNIKRTEVKRANHIKIGAITSVVACKMQIIADVCICSPVQRLSVCIESDVFFVRPENDKQSKSIRKHAHRQSNPSWESVKQTFELICKLVSIFDVSHAFDWPIQMCQRAYFRWRTQLRLD